MKKLLALIPALALVLVLCACGGGGGEAAGGDPSGGSTLPAAPTREQEALEALRDASLTYNELATLINENPGVADDATVAGARTVSDALFEIKSVLDSGGHSDELYGEYTASLKDLKAAADRLLAQVKAALDGSQAAGEFPYDLAGGWVLSGGRNADGTEWGEADLEEALTLYGGMLQIVIDPDLTGTDRVIFRQGSGALYGRYEVINEEGIGMAFDNNGEEYRLIGKVAPVGERLVMLVTSDQEAYLYFAKMDEF